MSNITDAQVIRDETQDGANTALRVGSLLVSIATDEALNTAKISYTDAAVVSQHTTDINALEASQGVQDTAIALNTAKVGITPTQASNIATNNLKVSYTDAAIVAQHTSDISTLEAEQITQNNAIALNTAKVGITPTQANDIIANNAKVGLTSGGTTGQVLAKNSDTNFDTAWVDVSGGGSVEGTDVLSTGETVGKVLQADGDGTSSWVTLGGGGDALTSNPLSQFAATTKAQLNSVISDGTPLYVGDITGITPTQSADITANNAKISYTDAALVAQHTIDIDNLESEQTSQNDAIALNTAKVGITTTQANDIIANNAKVSYTDSALVAQHTIDIDALETSQGVQDAAIALNTSKISYTDAAIVAQNTIDITALETNGTGDIAFAVSDETTDLTTGVSKLTFRIPYAMTLTSVRASLGTAATGSSVIVDINQNGTTILSTKLSIDATEKTSTTASVPAVISNTSLTDDAEITVDIDQVGSTLAGKGLKVYLLGNKL